MKRKILATSTIAFAMFSGLALAQNATHPIYHSDDEKMMYEGNPAFVQFYTDDTLAEMRGDEDIKVAYNNLSEEERNKIKADCDRVNEIRGAAFGEVTQSLCQKIGEI